MNGEDSDKRDEEVKVEPVEDIEEAVVMSEPVEEVVSETAEEAGSFREQTEAEAATNPHQPFFSKLEAMFNETVTEDTIQRIQAEILAYRNHDLQSLFTALTAFFGLNTTYLLKRSNIEVPLEALSTFMERLTVIINPTFPIPKMVSLLHLILDPEASLLVLPHEESMVKAAANGLLDNMTKLSPTGDLLEMAEQQRASKRWEKVKAGEFPATVPVLTYSAAIAGKRVQAQAQSEKTGIRVVK